MAVYIVVVVIHLSNGLDLGAALSGGFIDARVAVSCPQKPKLLWDVVNRGQLMDLGFQLWANTGGSYSDVCQVNRLSELTR